MSHNIIFTLTLGLTIALCCGFLTQRMKLSPIAGYLIAGIIIGPNTPGIVADTTTAEQFAEIGIILLMFGVGMHFHLKDLLSVKNIALPGAISQILITSFFSMILARFFGWNWYAGAVYGIAIAVASTVVLTRVLSDNHNLYTPAGHLAVGWLIVEDLFTIFILVLLPAFFSVQQEGASNIWFAFFITILKITALIIFVLAAGKKILPKILSYTAKTGARDLFTLVVLVLALGMALGAAEFFGASVALGAFLAGMVVGQSDFSARAASEALPMKDAFSVLFFVSVGMLFNPAALTQNFSLILATLVIVLLVKPAAAIIVVKLLKQPLNKALAVGFSLGQIGEFSFILAGVGISLNVLPESAGSAIIAASVISIMLNPLLYKLIPLILKKFNKIPIPAQKETCAVFNSDNHKIVLVGFGPVGRVMTKILRFADIDVSVIEMNIDTVKEIRELKDEFIYAVHGDAANREILIRAGVENAMALIISTPEAPAKEIIEIAHSINPRIKIYINTTYLKDVKKLKEYGADAVFSGEGTVASELAKFLMCSLSIADEDFEKECKRFTEY